MANARQFMAARTAAWAKSGAPIPYDAEVEYLDSTAESFQWIETGVIPLRDSIKIAAKVRYLGSSDYQCSGIGNYVGSAGGQTGYVGNVFRLNTHGIYSGFKMSFNCAIYYGTSWNYQQGFVRNTTIEFEVDKTEVRAIGYEGWNSLKPPQSMDTRNDFDSNPIRLFNDDLTGSPSPSRVYWAKIWMDGVAVRDMIPVRFTNEEGESEGAIYDRVSGQLLRNAGTGAFVIGPDKTV